MARVVAVLVLAGFLAVASGCGSRPQRPAIRIIAAKVIGADVILKVSITGWKMAAPREGLAPRPHTGQWQIFADDRYAGFSYQRSYGILTGLPVGTYRIWVALARTDYSLVYPLIRSRPVTVHVSDGNLYSAETE